MNREYIIWTPPFCGSAGVRALHKLAEELRKHGQSVRLWSWGERRAGFDYVERLTPHMREEGIAVYPEIVAGNPLRFRNVARWVLFFPGILGGEKSYHPSEKIFTWTQTYYPGVPRLFPDILDRKLFHDAGLPRTQDCTFVHKGGKWKSIPELEGLTEITMSRPKTREELAHLLQTTGTLWSFDAHSSLLDEAYYCGAAVKVITEDGFRDFTPDLIFSQEVFERELAVFITETQALDYQGELQPLPPDNESHARLFRRKLLLWQMLRPLWPGTLAARRSAHYCEKLRRMGEPAGGCL
ncbi:hypothetical protein [uncultured Mailhella sp.]|uniref:hypothetical protein n=1 Tax=uncultured Mailhella sp. TaxID=1981031 RepID=UPI0026324B62|nr:hypothetical protein [uncultured Mailhella sp.]